MFRFVIGKASDSQKIQTLDKEMKKYDDILGIDHEEENISSAKKTYDYLMCINLRIIMLLHV